LKSLRQYREILRPLTRLLLLLICLGGMTRARSQEGQASSYEIKAVFLFNFTRFVEWPPKTFESDDQPFVIGILGENPFGKTLDEVVVNEKVDNHPIRIRYFDKAADVVNCHLLFVSSRGGNSFARIAGTLQNRHILTVSDRKNFCQQGGVIHLYIQDQKIKIEINTENARASDLRISSKLLMLASVSK
jgi:hypothetical protein